MMRYLLIIAFMFLIITTPAYAYVWWPGTPHFVINETNDYATGVMHSVYPSGDVLRLGTVNEVFDVNTTYPNGTLMTANWTTTDPTDFYWSTSYGGTAYGNIERILNDYDQYTMPVTVITTNGSDFSFSFDYLATSQAHVIFGKWGLFNSSVDYTVNRNSQVKWNVYSSLTPVAPRFWGIRVWNDTGSFVNHNVYYQYVLNTWYHTYCYNDADGSSAGSYPLFNCTTFDSTGTTVLQSWEINMDHEDQATVDDLGIGDLDADTKVGTIVTYTDNYVFNNASVDEYPLTANWTSDNITITSDYLYNTTINMTAYNNVYLDRIEWINTSDDTVFASDDTDITVSGLTTYTDLSNVTTDFRIRLYMISNGTATPEVYDVIGNFRNHTVYCRAYLVADRVLW